MKKMNQNIVIGIDHGYGYIKSAETIIKSGIEAYPVKPPFDEDILEYNRQIFVAGQIRNEHPADKTKNDDYFYLTLVSLAKELKAHGLKEADHVILSVGLPYSFFTTQKEEFRNYLMKKKTLTFKYEGIKYSVTLKDVYVYPQGLPVLALEMEQYRDQTVSVCDIGSRTIDVITYRRGKPLYDSCFSIDKKGTLDCVDTVEKNFLPKFEKKIDEEDVQLIMQKRQTSLPITQESFVKEIIKFYARDVLKLLDSKLMDNLILCGGGASVVKNYGGKLRPGITVNEDIFCNAKGYEILTCNRLKK